MILAQLFPLLFLGVSTFANSISTTTTEEPDFPVDPPAPVEEKIVVCYWGSWSYYRSGDCGFDVENIDPSLCTHVIYAFAGLDETTNEIDSMDPWLDLEEDWGLGKYAEVNDLKLNNSDLKTLIAIGGWNEGSVKYSNMAKNETARAVFVQSAVEFVSYYGFDGLDLDWEYPANRGGIPEDKENFVLLCQELKAAFEPYGYLLTAAVGAGYSTMESAYNIPALCGSLDLINLMTYDFHGSWENVTGYHSALYSQSTEMGDATKLNTDYAVKYWIAEGCPSEKLILGVGTYGRGWTLANSSINGLGALAPSGISAGPCTGETGFRGYNEICQDLKTPGWTVVRDEDELYGPVTPYAYNDKFWISYDDPKSIARKSAYIMEENLGGGMIWSLETDDFHGKCGDGKNPILKALNKGLGRTTSEPEVPTTTTTTSSANSNDTTTTSTTPIPCTQPPTYSCKIATGFEKDEYCCSQFYQCANGVTYPKACPNNLQWNQNIQNCDWEYNVKCVNQPGYCCKTIS